MSKIKAILPALFVLTVSLQAQSLPCSGGRFLDPVFTEVNVLTDLPYGEALTMAGESQTLLLDVYEPSGDNLNERPLVIMAHGGSFLAGDRSETAEFCLDFAKRGYVCANIEYRLLDRLVLDSTGIIEAAFMAINDMRAAVRYFKEDAANSNVYGISSDHIFVAGVSAGAIMANHVGFLDTLDQIPAYIQTIIEKHGGFEGNSSENTHYSSEVEGVLNYSGALTRSHWIDSDDAPVYSAHDDKDPIVPCAYGTSKILPFPVYLYGSCAMKTVADQMKVSNQLYLVPNSTDHVSYFQNDSAQIKRVLYESAAFLKTLICGEASQVAEENTTGSPGISVFPNPFRDRLYVESEALIMEISVRDLSGKTHLLVEDYSGNGLELSRLPSGIYLIHLKTEQGSFIIKAFKE